MQSSGASKPPRYSILLPVKNGMPFLESTLDSILQIDEDSVEILASDDHSNDGSFEFLNSLNDPRLRILRPPPGLSMSEHWDWLLTNANGNWQMFVGQDDGLHASFFSRAERVTRVAEGLSLRAIVARRSYYFWPGTEAFYKNWRAKYLSFERVSIRVSRKELNRALRGEIDYFELPQMYVSSLFHKSLLEEARRLGNGKVILSHPQDASLVAVGCTIERRFLRSEVPLGWVGSSIKSAGLAIAMAQGNSHITDEMRELSKEYRHTILASDMSPSSSESFKFVSTELYLLQALAATKLHDYQPIKTLADSVPGRVYILAASFHRLLQGQEFRGRLRRIQDASRFFGVPWLATISIAPLAFLTRRSVKMLLKVATLYRFLLSIFRGSPVRIFRYRDQEKPLAPEDFIRLTEEESSLSDGSFPISLRKIKSSR